MLHSGSRPHSVVPPGADRRPLSAHQKSSAAVGLTAIMVLPSRTNLANLSSICPSLKEKPATMQASNSGSRLSNFSRIAA